MQFFAAMHDDTEYPTRRPQTATLRLPGIERLIARPAAHTLRADDVDALTAHAAQLAETARLATYAVLLRRDRPELADLLGL